MIKLLSQCVLITIKFYQEKSQQIIEFIRANPYEASALFETIKIDAYNVNQLLASLNKELDLFDSSETVDIYNYVAALKESVSTMEIFLGELEEIADKHSQNNDLGDLDFSKFKFEDTDGGAA